MHGIIILDHMLGTLLRWEIKILQNLKWCLQYPQLTQHSWVTYLVGSLHGQHIFLLIKPVQHKEQIWPECCHSLQMQAR